LNQVFSFVDDDDSNRYRLLVKIIGTRIRKKKRKKSGAKNLGKNSQGNLLVQKEEGRRSHKTLLNHHVS